MYYILLILFHFITILILKCNANDGSIGIFQPFLVVDVFNDNSDHANCPQQHYILINGHKIARPVLDSETLLSFNYDKENPINVSCSRLHKHYKVMDNSPMPQFKIQYPKNSPDDIMMYQIMKAIYLMENFLTNLFILEFI
jgi:hypothetical protein